MKKISCLVPAYNEDVRIGRVLSAVVGHPFVDEVIVIDDGSTDCTGDVARSFSGVRVVRHEKNQGKSRAIVSGITEASHELLLFLDADLCGLTPQDITFLIAPVRTGHADISISLRGNTPFFWRMIGLDYISGERVLPRALLADHLRELAALPRFGIEVFMNEIILREKLRLSVISLPRVSSPYKFQKREFWRGLWGEVKMNSDIFRTVSVFEAVRQIVGMRRLRV